MENSVLLAQKLKYSVYMQARYIGGGSTAFKLPHTAPPIYINSDLKGPLTAGVRNDNSLPMLIPSCPLSEFARYVRIAPFLFMFFINKKLFKSRNKIYICYYRCLYVYISSLLVMIT